MNLSILSPEALLFKGEVESVTLPGTSGYFQILNNHTPLVSTLAAGKVKIQGKINLDFAMFISSLAAAENINNFANKNNLVKNNLIRSIDSYLK